MANIKRANALGITKTGVAISDVPDAPTIGVVADLGTGSTASVAYTAATTGGTATTFTATSSPGGLTGTGSSPITVSGLTAGTAYTFTVTASNTTGSKASAASSSLTLAAVGVYESIATVTGTGSAGSLTFSSIPSTYSHLQIRGMYKDTSTTDYDVSVCLLGRANSITSGYTKHNLIGYGTVAGVQNSINEGYLGFGGCYMSSGGSYTNMFSPIIIDIHNYASTTQNKTIRYITGNDANQASTNRVISLGSNLIQSTSAISSLTFYPADSGFAAGSTFALYGIKGS